MLCGGTLCLPPPSCQGHIWNFGQSQIHLFLDQIFFCQTPTPGQTWELNLLLHGNKKKIKNKNINARGSLMSTSLMHTGKSKILMCYDHILCTINNFLIIFVCLWRPFSSVKTNNINPHRGLGGFLNLVSLFAKLCWTFMVIIMIPILFGVF